MANRRGAFIVLRISRPSLSAHRRIMLAGEGARPTCGSPALRNGEYCYFHRRWRLTTVDISHCAHHVTTEFVLPVLDDADAIQITLGQIMRMIVCRHQYSPLFTTKSSRRPALSPAGRGIWRGSAQGLMFMRHRRR